jgi:hypothetical protein
MRNTHAAEAGSEAVVRDQLVGELEHELESEARRTGSELTPADAFVATPANTFLATPANTFVATSVNAVPGRSAA